jgi:hypothetical protein
MDPRSGQIGIILLLTTVVMLTLGISIVSRTSTDVSLSRGSQNATQALDAAESGVEQALSSDLTQSTGGQITSIPNVNVNYTVGKSTTLQTFVNQGTSVSVNVTGVPGNTDTLIVQWAKESSCVSPSNPASLIVAIYGSSPDVRYAHLAACSHTNPVADGFTVQGAGTGGFFRKATLSLKTTDKLVRIRPVYNDTFVQVTGGGWTLPVQQYQVSSVATNTTTSETKAVSVSRSLLAPPAVMDYAIYSGGGITQ